MGRSIARKREIEVQRNEKHSVEFARQSIKKETETKKEKDVAKREETVEAQIQEEGLQIPYVMQQSLFFSIEDEQKKKEKRRVGFRLSKVTRKSRARRVATDSFRKLNVL